MAGRKSTETLNARLNQLAGRGFQVTTDEWQPTHRVVTLKPLEMTPLTEKERAQAAGAAAVTALLERSAEPEGQADDLTEVFAVMAAENGGMLAQRVTEEQIRYIASQAFSIEAATALIDPLS